jgi:hypothetical protein
VGLGFGFFFGGLGGSGSLRATEKRGGRKGER